MHDVCHRKVPVVSPFGCLWSSLLAYLRNTSFPFCAWWLGRRPSVREHLSRRKFTGASLGILPFPSKVLKSEMPQDFSSP